MQATCEIVYTKEISVHWHDVDTKTRTLVLFHWSTTKLDTSCILSLPTWAASHPDHPDLVSALAIIAWCYISKPSSKRTHPRSTYISNIHFLTFCTAFVPFMDTCNGITLSPCSPTIPPLSLLCIRQSTTFSSVLNPSNGFYLLVVNVCEPVRQKSLVKVDRSRSTVSSIYTKFARDGKT